MQDIFGNCISYTTSDWKKYGTKRGGRRSGKMNSLKWQWARNQVPTNCLSNIHEPRRWRTCMHTNYFNFSGMDWILDHSNCFYFLTWIINYSPDKMYTFYWCHNYYWTEFSVKYELIYCRELAWCFPECSGLTRRWLSRHYLSWRAGRECAIDIAGTASLCFAVFAAFGEPHRRTSSTSHDKHLFKFRTLKNSSTRSFTDITN